MKTEVCCQKFRIVLISTKTIGQYPSLSLPPLSSNTRIGAGGKHLLSLEIPFRMCKGSSTFSIGTNNVYIKNLRDFEGYHTWHCSFIASGDCRNFSSTN